MQCTHAVICCGAADDDEDTEVLDPAQLAMVYADQQTNQQPQTEALQLQLQLPSLQHLQPEQHQQQQHTHADVQQPADLQSNPDSAAAQHLLPQQQVTAEQMDASRHAVSAEQVQGWRQGDRHEQEEHDDEEELICMDDPRFASLSERKQKLMALEEILLNTGIEG